MLRTKAVVIRRQPALNNDVFLTLLTDRVGKLDIVAGRARLMKSPHAAAAKLFVYGSFIIDTRHKIPRLVSCDIIRSNYRLIDDYDALMYASYFVEVINRTAQHGVSDTDQHDLLVHLLELLANDAVSKKYLRAMFLVKLTAFLGWMPDLRYCAICGAPLEEPLYFDASNGPVCAACGRTNRIGAKFLRMLRYLMEVRYDRAHRANIPENDLNQAIFLIESFFRYQADLPPFESAEYLI